MAPKPESIRFANEFLADLERRETREEAVRRLNTMAVGLLPPNVPAYRFVIGVPEKEESKAKCFYFGLEGVNRPRKIALGEVVSSDQFAAGRPYFNIRNKGNAHGVRANGILRRLETFGRKTIELENEQEDGRIIVIGLEGLALIEGRGGCKLNIGVGEVYDTKHDVELVLNGRAEHLTHSDAIRRLIHDPHAYLHSLGIHPINH